MIEEPKVGMKVRVIKSYCCSSRHRANEKGVIIHIAPDRSFIVSSKEDDMYGWWHMKQCVVLEDTEPEPEQHAIYLGDGVYASYSGFGIWLRTGDHRAALCDNEIYFESEVLKTFQSWIKQHLGKKETS